MPPSRTRPAVASGSVFSHTANCAAACLCLDPSVTPVVEPPQLPVLFSPAAHCGIAAISHLPLVLAAFPASTPGAQTALGQTRYVPSLSALFHSGVNIGLPST